MKNLKQFNRKFNKRFFIIHVILLTIILIGITYFAISYVERIEEKIENTTKATLQLVSSQNVKTIQKEVFSKQEFLKVVADDMEREERFNILENIERFKKYVRDYDFYNMGLINKDGVCYTTLDEKLDLHNYDYFKRGMKGEVQISQSYKSEDKKMNLNIYIVPVYQKNKVKMLLTATYASDKFLEQLNTTSFQGIGGSFAVNGAGKLVAHPKGIENHSIDDLDWINKDSLNAFENMKSNIKEERVGYIEYRIDEENYLGFYEPVGINDWYLISYVPKNYIDKNMNELTKEVRIISVIIIIAFCCFSGIWILYCFLYQRGVNNRIFYDSLTKEKNYEYLKHAFYKEDSKNKSLIALDIDKFKIINMMYGLNVGDQMLLYLYGTFKEVLPKDILYRNKADEFVGIIYHETKQELMDKLELLNQKIQEDMKNNKIYHMTISIGVCALEGYSSLQRIYGNAIIAKNQIKGNTNIVYNFFDDKLRESFIECGRMESKFESALGNQEFEVWYQPKYNMKDEKIVSAEALVRWRDENGHLISPGKFIPVFEKNGQIIRLDEEIIKIVYKDLREAKEFGIQTVPVSINLSRLHLDCPGFIGRIEQLTKEYGIKPSEIVFEITESALLGDKESLNCFIEGLHRLGFRVDMDDYGTGVSSLDSLSSFSFDTIKLDKSFIDNIGNKKMDIVIKSTIKMTKDLDMQIIAEGVETIEQVKFLLENDCLIAQGFYYSKPLKKEQYFLKLHETKEKMR